MSVKPYSDGWCIYYRTVMNHKTCRAGVNYHEVWDGVPFRERPCFLDKGRSRPNARYCPMLRRPTKEEMEADRIEEQSAILRVGEALTAAAAYFKEHPGVWSATIPCPSCGCYGLAIAKSRYNGHLSGICPTPNCVQFVQ